MSEAVTSGRDDVRGTVVMCGRTGGGDVIPDWLEGTGEVLGSEYTRVVAGVVFAMVVMLSRLMLGTGVWGRGGKIGAGDL